MNTIETITSTTGRVKRGPILCAKVTISVLAEDTSGVIA